MDKEVDSLTLPQSFNDSLDLCYLSTYLWCLLLLLGHKGRVVRGLVGLNFVSIMQYARNDYINTTIEYCQSTNSKVIRTLRGMAIWGQWENYPPPPPPPNGRLDNSFMLQIYLFAHRTLVVLWCLLECHEIWVGYLPRFSWRESFY